MLRYFNELSNKLMAQEMVSPSPVRWYHHLNRFIVLAVIVYGIYCLASQGGK